VEFTYLVEGDSSGPLVPEAQIATYRIAQELLNNVVKHSGATECEVVFSYLPDAIELTISDNGRGFDPQDVGLEHMGLAIMSERARAIGGQLTVDSKPNAGTRAVFCWQPRREKVQ
jgi:signal transduction histidine kinase